MTIAETQTPNPLETVSEYWYSLSAPRQYDLQKHQQEAQHQEKTSSSHMDLSIDTSLCASLPSTSAPSTASPSGSSHQSLFSTELLSDSNRGDNNIRTGSTASEMAPAHKPLTRTTSASTSNLSVMTTTNTAAALASSIQCLHSSASEQGKLLAQRSRTSLNRFLDSVLDNATSLAESSDAHESYSEGDDDNGDNGVKAKDQLRDRKSRMKMSPPSKPPRLIMPSPHTQRLPAVRKPMFFVSESDSEEEEEEEHNVESENKDEKEEDDLSMMIRKKPSQPATVFQQPEEHEADGDCEASENEKEDVVDNDMAPMVRSPHLLHKPNNTHAPIHARRQSLLSNLLQAEKLQSSSASTVAETMSLYPARPSQHLQEAQQQRDLKHNGTPYQPIDSQASNEDGSLKAHLLVRTKKVYKNLDELAKASALTTTTPHSLTTAVTASNIPTCELSSTTTPMASTVLSSWSRSRSQVQVQIQSLVVQSTSTAQRALLSASATLTDVLFRSSAK
ncbi:hypothetical protein BGZ51_002496 [Haplosporangium sp. Z 767]|nr:hypothetical protein BGZ51_002496 [Haplosporangium sp. Z 767]